MKAFRIETIGAALRYHDFPGIEPALVFIHGLGDAGSASFPGIVRHPELAAHRAIVVDLIGYGFSDRPRDFDYRMESQAGIVADLLRSLTLEDCILVGHSMGGAVAILLAAGHRPLVSRLILAESNLDPEPGFVSGPITAMPEDEFVEQGYAKFLDVVRRNGFLSYEGALRAAAPWGLHRSAVSLIADRSPTYREHLLKMTLPRTFLFGDENADDPDVKRLAEDGITVGIIQDAGHDMMGDNPDGFAEAVAHAMG